MAGLGAERGDSRLKSGRKRSVLRGADTIITVETGLNQPTRAKTLKPGDRGKPRSPSALPNRLNRRFSQASSPQLRKIDAVGTPEVGNSIAANEEAIAKTFGTPGVSRL